MPQQPSNGAAARARRDAFTVDHREQRSRCTRRPIRALQLCDTPRAHRDVIILSCSPERTRKPWQADSVPSSQPVCPNHNENADRRRHGGKLQSSMMTVQATNSRNRGGTEGWHARVGSAAVAHQLATLMEQQLRGARRCAIERLLRTSGSRARRGPRTWLEYRPGPRGGVRANCSV